MKKLIQILIFIITFVLILVLDFWVYKNIDKIIPTHQNEVHTFENKTSMQRYNFIYEMAIQIEETDSFKRILDNEAFLKENPIILNIIRNYIQQEDIDYILLYEGELENTIYGNLKFITSRDYYADKYNKKKVVYTNFYIVYSEDMKKICYYNFNTSKGLEPNDYSVKIKDENHQATLYDYSVESSEGYDDEEKNSAEAVKNKDELIEDVKEEFTKINLNIDIKPNTILKKTDFYIFQDEENKVTIYYDNDNNMIFGFCIGFEN